MKFLNQVLEQFKQIPPSKRVVIMLVSAVMMGGFIFLTVWAQKPEYKLLYANLSPEDASSIVEKLKSDHVEYRLEGAGKTILVPSDSVYELRLQLASEGLPQGGGVGFEIFDKTSFGSTKFAQEINYLRALQGELSRTISQIEEVDQAKVHIVVPKETLFKEDQKETTASVVLKLRNSRSMTQTQIQGIVHLIAGAVEGLTPENITMVDRHGNILSGGEDSSVMGRMTSGQLNYKNMIETRLESKLKSLLDGVLGVGKAIVRVSTEVNFLQEERTEEIYDPDSQVARSEQKNEEISTGSAPVGGIPGVQSNLPGAATGGRQAFTAPKNSKINETKNYEINKITRKIVEAVGTIKRVSVAVAIDGLYEKEGDNGEKKYIPRSEEELAKYRELVKKAIGFNDTRGDIVEVSNVAFHAEDVWVETDSMKSEASRAFWVEIVKYVMSGAALIFIIIFVLKPIVHWATTIEGRMPFYVKEEASMGTGDGGVALDTEEKPQKEKAAGEIVRDYVESDPENSAKIVSGWLGEDYSV